MTSHNNLEEQILSSNEMNEARDPSCSLGALSPETNNLAVMIRDVERERDI